MCIYYKTLNEKRELIAESAGFIIVKKDSFLVVAKIGVYQPITTKKNIILLK